MPVVLTTNSAEQTRPIVQFPAGARDFSLFPKQARRLWGPPSHLFNDFTGVYIYNVAYTFTFTSIAAPMGLGRRRKVVTRGDDLTPIVVTTTAVTTCSRCEMTRTDTSAISVQGGAAPAGNHWWLL